MLATQPHPECLNAVGEWDRRRAAQYRKKLTRGAREFIYERDNWTCQLCGLAFDKNTRWRNEIGYAPSLSNVPGHRFWVLLEIDHIVPIRHGGTHDPNNLRALCQPCNSRKGHKHGQPPLSITVRADDPQSIVATLRRELPPEVLNSVVNLLNKSRETES
jgi:5-methylcytosine-specific restriction endonuclease McrA